MASRHKFSCRSERAAETHYEPFRLADTPEWEKAFEFALPVVGLKNWEEAK